MECIKRIRENLISVVRDIVEAKEDLLIGYPLFAENGEIFKVIKNDGVIKFKMVFDCTTWTVSLDDLYLDDMIDLVNTFGGDGYERKICGED